MKLLYLNAAKERLAFVERAAEHFYNHPQHRTYTDDAIEPGCFFAVRWGLGGDCVLVLKLDESEDPTVFEQVIAHAPDCALVTSLVADCDCYLAKLHGEEAMKC